MGRPAKLAKKNGHWYSEAGGQPRYYGKVGVVSFAEASKAFPRPAGGPRGGFDHRRRALVEAFGDWLAKNRRPGDDCSERRKVPAPLLHPARRLAGDSCGIVTDHSVSGKSRGRSRLCPQAPDHDQDDVPLGRAAPAPARRDQPSRPGRARQGPSQGPPGDRIRPPELEVKAPFRWGDADLQAFHKVRGSRPRRPDEYRIEVAGFADMLRCYHATGSRTGETCAVRVGDFHAASRQLVLGKHKRSHNVADPPANRPQ